MDVILSSALIDSNAANCAAVSGLILLFLIFSVQNADEAAKLVLQCLFYAPALKMKIKRRKAGNKDFEDDM